VNLEKKDLKKKERKHAFDLEKKQDSRKEERAHANNEEKKNKKTRSRPHYRPRKKASFKNLLFSFINSRLRWC